MFKKRRGIHIPYNKQGLIYFTCVNIDEMPEEIQNKIGHEFADESLDPLQKRIEAEEGNFYEDRDVAFEKGLSMLGQALETLTSRQKLVFETVVYGKSRRDLAEELGISHTAINKTYNQALTKLKKFFLAYPEFIAYFPKLNQL